MILARFLAPCAADCSSRTPFLQQTGPRRLKLLLQYIPLCVASACEAVTQSAWKGVPLNYYRLITARVRPD